MVEKTVKAGDNVGTGSNSNNTLCIIYDLSYLQMTLNIDELDIDNVEVGQVVNITSDAKEGQTPAALQPIPSLSALTIPRACGPA